jgi:FixJ family two-component response regulator
MYPLAHGTSAQVVPEYALTGLARSDGLRVETFSSAKEYLPCHEQSRPRLVFDVDLPAVTGLVLQAELLRAEAKVPIVFATGHGDIPMSVRSRRGLWTSSRSLSARTCS